MPRAFSIVENPMLERLSTLAVRHGSIGASALYGAAVGLTPSRVFSRPVKRFELGFDSSALSRDLLGDSAESFRRDRLPARCISDDKPPAGRVSSPPLYNFCNRFGELFSVVGVYG